MTAQKVHSKLLATPLQRDLVEDTISIQILPQAPDEEHSEYDEDSELEKIGNKFEKFIQLQLLEDFSGEVARLKLKYGDKVCEFVAGKRESVIETSG